MIERLQRRVARMSKAAKFSNLIYKRMRELLEEKDYEIRSLTKRVEGINRYFVLPVKELIEYF